MAVVAAAAPLEPPVERHLRLAWLRVLVEQGDYFVPAEEVALDLLRHLGLAPKHSAPQQR